MAGINRGDYADTVTGFLDRHRGGGDRCDLRRIRPSSLNSRAAAFREEVARKGVAEESRSHREQLAQGQSERERLLSRTQALEGQVADLEAKLKQALEDSAAARSAADAARQETEGVRGEMAQALDRSENAKSEAESLRDRIDKILDERAGRRRARFLQAMRGKRSGRLEIVSVAGSEALQENRIGTGGSLE